MVRFVGRDVVRFGHWDGYQEAAKTWKAVAVKMGLPEFRFSTPTSGTMQEVFFEAEFEDGADVERRFAAAAAAKNPEWEAAFAGVESHITDGHSYSHVLSDMALD